MSSQEYIDRVCIEVVVADVRRATDASQSELKSLRHFKKRVGVQETGRPHESDFEVSHSMLGMRFDTR